MNAAFPLRSPLSFDHCQSEDAARVQKGVRRLLFQMGQTSLCEVPLACGRRADIMSICDKGQITIIEIKSSLNDLRCDQKWHFYAQECDFFYFAAPGSLSMEDFPPETGFIMADAYGGAILRHAASHPLNPARRKMVMLRFARLAATRLHQLADPERYRE